MLRACNDFEKCMLLPLRILAIVANPSTFPSRKYTKLDGFTRRSRSVVRVRNFLRYTLIHLGNCKRLLLGVRGSLWFARRDKRSWQTWNRTRHSKKPSATRCLIESVSPGPYLELFGREEIANSEWTVLGNQIERPLF
jgi:hypothetical protein